MHLDRCTCGGRVAGRRGTSVRGEVGHISTRGGGAHQYAGRWGASARAQRLEHRRVEEQSRTSYLGTCTMCVPSRTCRTAAQCAQSACVETACARLRGGRSAALAPPATWARWPAPARCAKGGDVVMVGCMIAGDALNGGCESRQLWSFACCGDNWLMLYC